MAGILTEFAKKSYLECENFRSFERKIYNCHYGDNLLICTRNVQLYSF